MIPEKHINDLKSSESREGLLSSLAISVTFLLFFLLIGALIHEAAHISFLVFIDCFYNFSPGFSFLNGFHASVQPLCSMNSYQLFTFYAVGYPATLLAGIILNTVSYRLKGLKSGLFAAAGTGTLLSVLLTVGHHGDIHNAVGVVGGNTLQAEIATVFIILGVMIGSLKGIDLLLEREE